MSDKCWLFRRGEWDEIDNPWADSQKNFDEDVKEAGYDDVYLQMGKDRTGGGVHLTVYRRGEGELPEFVALFDPVPGCSWDYVFVADLPSVIAFASMMAPIVQAQYLPDLEEGLNETLRTGFDMLYEALEGR